MLFIDTLVFYYELQGKYLSGGKVVRTTHIDILVREKKRDKIKRSKGQERYNKREVTEKRQKDRVKQTEKENERKKKKEEKIEKRDINE